MGAGCGGIFGAVGVHGRARLSAARGACAGELQGSGRLEAGQARRCHRPRCLVVDLQRSGARRIGKADRHLEPEPQSGRSGVPSGGVHRRPGARRVLSNRDLERVGPARAGQRQLQWQHRDRRRARQYRQPLQWLGRGELDAGSLGADPPHGREQCRQRAGECGRPRRRTARRAGPARRRLSAIARRR